jgi:CheY-like chemotaxis protein
MARVLVVEDDLDQLATRRQLLEHAGYEVFTAQTAAEALPLLEACQVVVMDLRIPKIDDGLQLIDAAAEVSARVIVLSGLQYETPLKVDEFLMKPCPSRKLIETVARLCARAQGA